MKNVLSRGVYLPGIFTAYLLIGGLFLFDFVPDAEAAKTKKIKNKDIASNAAIFYGKLDLQGNINSKDIQNGAIDTVDIAKDAIISSRIKDGTIVADDLADSSITSEKIMNGEVITDDLANSAVTSLKIADGTIDSADIASNTITSAKLLDGTILTADLADDSINSAKIIDGTIVVSDLASDSVTSVKILNGAVINEDIGDSAAIAYSKLNLTSSILTGDIATDTILAGNIATDAVDSAEIKANAVTASEIATDAVDSEEIKADAVTASEIATDGVATAEILDGTIANADISSTGAIAYSKINLASSIVTGDITDGTIVNGDVSSSAAIAYSKLNLVSSIVTGDIANGTISGSDLANDITLGGNLTLTGGELGVTPKTTSSSTTEGTVYYDSDDDNLYVYANGAWVDLTAGAAGAATLDDAYNASAGAATVSVDAGNLTLRSNAASSLGDIIIDLNSTGDFLIKDANVTYATFGDDQTITLGNNAGTVAINSSDWDVTSEGAITGVSFDANGSGNSITNIESADITDGTIATGDIATDTITAGNIATDAVDSAEIKASAVGTSEITDASIEGTDLAANVSISTSGNIATTGSGTITSAGAIAANGGITTNGGDDLGALASRWSTIYADTLNFKDTLTDVATNSTVTFGDSANTTITMGDSNVLDTLNIVANTGISDAQWSVSASGAAAFASATVGGNNVVTVGDTGTVTSAMILDGTIAGGDLAANIAITTSGAASFTGNVSLGSGNNDTIAIDADTWDISSAGAASLTDLTATGNSTLGNSATDTVDFQGDITIGHGAGNDVSVDSGTWDISTAGAATGLTGVTATGNINLSSATYIRVPKAAEGETCDANAKGSIYYDTDNDNFYGCNGSSWVQLNNAP